VTEKSIIEAVAQGERITLESPVGEVMDEPFPQLDQSAPLTVVTELLKYDPAVLLTRKGKITGIITKSDLLKTIC
jgi:predicted transcriptional regulator